MFRHVTHILVLIGLCFSWACEASAQLAVGVPSQPIYETPAIESLPITESVLTNEALPVSESLPITESLSSSEAQPTIESVPIGAPLNTEKYLSAIEAPAQSSRRKKSDRFPLSSSVESHITSATGSLGTRIGVALLLSVALCVVLAIATRHNGAGRLATDRSAVSLVSTVKVAPRCFVSLLRVEGKDVLVSQDASGIKQMLMLGNDFGSIVDASQDFDHAEKVSNDVPIS